MMSGDIREGGGEMFVTCQRDIGGYLHMEGRRVKDLRLPMSRDILKFYSVSDLRLEMSRDIMKFMV